MKKIIKGFFAILLLCLTVSSVSVKAANNDKGTWTNLSIDDNNILRGGSLSPMAVLNNKIYNSRNDGNSNIIEEYDPIHDKWFFKTNMISKKRVGSLQVVNNKIYALCEGDDANSGLIEEYNPETNKCTTKANMLSSPFNPYIVITNNKIYIFNKALWRLEEYNPETNKSTVKTKFDNELPNNLLLGVVNNKIYVMGGVDSNKVIEYDTETNKLTSKSQMSIPIASGEVAVVNNKIYVIGGVDTRTRTHTNVVQEYNPEIDKWSVKTSMTFKKNWHQVVVLNNKIYAIGGYYTKDSNVDNNVVLNAVEEYNPEINEWTSKADMNSPRNRHKALVANDKIYVFGGNPIIGDPKTAMSTAEVFTQETESKNSLNISLDKTSINLIEGETATLTATITPKDSTNKKVIWSSSDESIVTVDEKGNVTAVKKGQAKITAKIDGTNVSASCDVNVTEKDVPVEPSKPEIKGDAVLFITMTNGNIKSYNVSMKTVNKFIEWYKDRASGSNGNPFYEFDKTKNEDEIKTEYIVFDKISSFQVEKNK